MNDSVQAISVGGIAWVFVPALLVLAIMHRWGREARSSGYALTRMLLQLLLVGYVLVFIFSTERASVVMLVLTVMMVAAGWIALRPVTRKDTRLYLRALAAIAVGGVPVLALVTQVTLDIKPWFEPRYLVPLGGMIFASSMNTVSLAAERFEADMGGSQSYVQARDRALQTSMIPTVNGLLAVGLVTLPGMMTGQILSGVPPLVAVKYQIVVMCMVFASAGISAATYLFLLRPRKV